MNTKLILPILLFVVTGGAFADEPTKLEQANNEIADLKKQLHETQLKVTALEKTVTELVKQVDSLKKSSPIVVAPEVPSSVPKQWEQHEFNGQTYFVIPLGWEPGNPTKRGDLTSRKDPSMR
jgi:hypothetical protein